MTRLALAIAALVGSAAAQVIKPSSLTKHTTVFADNRLASFPELPQMSLRSLSSVSVTAAGNPSASDAPSESFAYIAADNAMVVMDDEGGKIDVYEINSNGVFTWIISHDISAQGDPQSVAYNDAVVVCAIDSGGRIAGDAAGVGKVAVFARSTIKQAVAPFYVDLIGYLPDHVSFTPDDKKLLVAMEAEARQYDGTANKHDDAPGGVSLITLTSGGSWLTQADYNVDFIDFTAFDNQLAAAQAAGVHMPLTTDYVERLEGENITTVPKSKLSQSLEPEYITYSSDSSKAYVICQEASTIAVLDLAATTPSFTELRPLGWKSWDLNELDPSNKDDKLGNFKTLKNLWTMFQPDAITTYTVDGKDYIVTANEGDAKALAEPPDTGDWYFGEEARIKDILKDLDDTAFPDKAAFGASAEFGRLKVSLTEGRDTSTNKFVELVGFGGRSWSIWDASDGSLVWDSGSQVEKISYEVDYTRPFFNGQGTHEDADSRSDDKGPEAESVTLGVINGRTYLFGGAERSSIIYMWDITDPTEVVFTSLNMASDCSDKTVSLLRDPESMQFVPAAQSPTGRDLLLVTGAKSGTLHSFDVVAEAPVDECEGATVSIVPNTLKKHTTVFADNRKDDFSSVPDMSLRVMSSVSVEDAGKSDPSDAPSESFVYIAADNAMIVMDDAGGNVDVYEVLYDGSFKFVISHDISAQGDPQSVAYNDDVVVCAIDSGGRSAADAAGVGKIAVFPRSTIKEKVAPFYVDLIGYLPDHVSFTPDGKKLLVAMEAEAKQYSEGSAGHADSEGGVTLITLADGGSWTKKADYVTKFIHFRKFNNLVAEASAAGVHLPLTTNYVERLDGENITTVPKATLAQSIEPEYVTYASDSSKAYVICQEASTIAVLDLALEEFTELRPLGWKSWGLNQLDPSNKDDKLGNFKTLNNLWTMFQPDAITTYTVDGKDYIVTANEGDAKSLAEPTEGNGDWYFGEEKRIKKVVADFTLDSTAFPDTSFGDDADFGRLKVTLTEGRNASGAFVELVGFGGRSWSIWDASDGSLVWDSGSQVEKISYEVDYTRPFFNGQGTHADADSRSDDKGPEAESVSLGVINGRTYLFGGAERSSIIYVWDITKPTEVVFTSLNMAPDCSDETVSLMRDPESMQFVPAAQSPTGRDMLLAVGAKSGTLHSFDVVAKAPVDMCTLPQPGKRGDYVVISSMMVLDGTVELFNAQKERFKSAIINALDVANLLVENLAAKAGSIIVTYDLNFPVNEDGEVTTRDGETFLPAEYLESVAEDIDEAVAAATGLKVLNGTSIVADESEEEEPPTIPTLPPGIIAVAVLIPIAAIACAVGLGCYFCRGKKEQGSRA